MILLDVLWLLGGSGGVPCWIDMGQIKSDLSPPVGHPKMWQKVGESPQNALNSAPAKDTKTQRHKPLNSGLGIIVI